VLPPAFPKHRSEDALRGRPFNPARPARVAALASAAPFYNELRAGICGPLGAALEALKRRANEDYRRPAYGEEIGADAVGPCGGGAGGGGSRSSSSSSSSSSSGDCGGGGAGDYDDIDADTDAGGGLNVDRLRPYQARAIYNAIIGQCHDNQTFEHHHVLENREPGELIKGNLHSTPETPAVYLATSAGKTMVAAVMALLPPEWLKQPAFSGRYPFEPMTNKRTGRSLITSPSPGGMKGYRQAFRGYRLADVDDCGGQGGVGGGGEGSSSSAAHVQRAGERGAVSSGGASLGGSEGEKTEEKIEDFIFPCRDEALIGAQSGIRTQVRTRTRSDTDLT
jgi:hypothetical protein